MKFIRVASLITGLTVFSVMFIQLQAWWSRNGFSPTGTMPNHFGERYSTDVVSWVLRGFLSPFAWFGVLLIAAFWFIVVVTGNRLLRGVRKRGS